MHYHAEVWVRDRDRATVEADVERAMSPHQEAYDETTEEHHGFWDWYVIGGRWTGVKSKTNPTKDPRNYETCFLCQGGGQRNDTLGRRERQSDPSYSCNGCGGTGQMLKHESKWVKLATDIMPITDIPIDFECHTLLIPDCKPFFKEEWDGQSFKQTDFDGKVKSMLDKLHIGGGYLVTVDYHS